MLPAQHRLRQPADYAAVLKAPGGARSGSRLIVIHANQIDARAGQPPRVGFVVSGAVGNAVQRNRTKRRLRAVMARRVNVLPSGADVVVRANPAAAQASFAELDACVNQQLPRVLHSFEAVPR